MAAGESRNRTSLPNKLMRLQLVGGCRTPFAAVPPSCQVPIECVLDEPAGDLQSTILLGFTRDGGHLLSYTTQRVAAADGQEGYCLQLWRYQPGQRCRRLWSVPLFRTPAYLDSLADEDSFTAADDLLLTLAEAPDGSLLVAHGRSAAPADAASRDHHLANHLSFIPGPLHAGAAQLQVSHLTYHTSYPHAAFNPYLFLTPLSPVPSTRTSTSSSTKEASQGGTTLAVALYSGSSVRYLHATVSRQAVQPAAATAARGRQLPPDQPRSAALTTEDSEMDSSSVFLSPGSSRSSTPSLQPPQAPPAAWQQQQQQQQPQHVQQPLPSQQQQQQQGAPTHSWPAFHHPPNASARSSPWRQPQQRQWQQQDQQQDQQQHVPLGADSMQQPCLDTHVCLVSCTHAGQHAGSKTSTWQAPSHGLASRRSGCVGGGGACQASAAVSLLEAPAQLDLEASIYAALQQRGVPPSALVDYAAAPMLACCWGEEEGLLLLAVLRLSRQPAPTGFGEEQRQEGSSQPQHRTACVLLHAAARSGVGAEVEWLEAPYPWHHDLSAFLVQQTAFSGVAFEKAPAFFAELMRARWAVPPSRHCLPFTLSNRSILAGAQSLQHIVHPWMPIAILGYRHGKAV